MNEKNEPVLGLTTEEALRRRAAGESNRPPKPATKSIGRIVRDNVCTLFNALHVFIAAALLLVGSHRNMLFLLVTFFNILIGTVQEIRSKRILDRLRVLHTPTARVMRDGEERALPVEEIVREDVIVLRRGSQIPADSRVSRGEIYVDESLLTGESEAVRKTEGDELLSGSFVTAGRAYARVMRVGAENYAAKLAEKARRKVRPSSQIMTSLRKLIRTISVFILPLGAAVLLRTCLGAHAPIQEAVEQAAASMIGMIPAGLMLLTSVSLAVSAVVLARRKALVQDLYSIESLARADVLCLDKTGTITAGEMTLLQTLPLHNGSASEAETMLAAYVAAMPADESGMAALQGLRRGGAAAPASVQPFDSKRKYGAALFENYGALYLGAPEAVCPGMDEALKKRVEAYADEGCRALLFARAEESAFPAAPRDAQPLFLLLLSDRIRPEAKDALAFFRAQGIKVRLISGDHPRTVAGIARQVGLEGCERSVDAWGMDDEALIAAARADAVIFGRVSPEQKQTLIRAFREAGHTAAMIGDGVNDVLALREADCSVAMAAGSDAARQAAQFVLLDNNFATLLPAVMEGRRVINNIMRTASLFLVKTVFSFLLTFLTLVFAFPYPFIPIQLTLISALTIGLPAFLLALEPNRSRVKGTFWGNVLGRALPGALCNVLFLALSYLLSPLCGLTGTELSTLNVYVSGAVGLCVLLRVCLPPNALRMAVFFGMTALFVAAAQILCGLLEITGGLVPILPLLLPMAAAAYPLLYGLERLTAFAGARLRRRRDASIMKKKKR